MLAVIAGMAIRLSDLTRVRRMIEDGERRIAGQELLIERLRADGHSTRMQDQVEQLIRDAYGHTPEPSD